MKIPKPEEDPVLRDLCSLAFDRVKQAVFSVAQLADSDRARVSILTSACLGTVAEQVALQESEKEAQACAKVMRELFNELIDGALAFQKSPTEFKKKMEKEEV